MNPLDNAQLTSQLAQLSTVTGVNKLNTTLETLKTSYQQAESMQAANIIGHGVLTAGKDINLSKSAALLGVDL
ncbi:flagellar hook capping FlgD N-terminal domain-containing protein, partial [Staphylococcus aureus]|nr:flagellar hook capping FlgD N-terminal domain-containing protein [Staphylococcus aureus]